MEFEFKFKWIEYEYSEEQEDYIEKVVQENSSIVDKDYVEDIFEAINEFKSSNNYGIVSSDWKHFISECRRLRQCNETENYCHYYDDKWDLTVTKLD